MVISNLLQDQRRWMAVMTGVLALGAAWAFLSRAPATATTSGAPPPSPREGFSAPDFTLELLEGGQISLSGLRGQAVLVNFWATWCPPCRAEMPAIERVYRSYRDLGLEVVAINLTDQDRETAVAAFVEELGLTFPIALDRDGSVSAQYILRGLPTSFFIDREGVIHAVVVGGPMSEALIQSRVEALLEKTP